MHIVDVDVGTGHNIGLDIGIDIGLDVDRSQ